MYVTFKLDDRGCRIHSISDGNEEIVKNERYVVMPWKMVTRSGANMTLKEAADRILNQKESKNKELEGRKREREQTENKLKEYYEAHMKEETERLNELVDWYKCKLKEINEAPVDSRLRKLEKLYQRSEKNEDLGVTITRAGTLNQVDYPGYPPPEYEDNGEIVFYSNSEFIACWMNEDLGVTITRARTLNQVLYPGYPPPEYKDNEEIVFYSNSEFIACWI